jgi:Plasmid pRiA4b ORF-3-like protein
MTPGKKSTDAVECRWQLRVELMEVTPRVWRRILLPEAVKLHTLRRILQASLGWTNSHLHQLTTNGNARSGTDCGGLEAE